MIWHVVSMKSPYILHFSLDLVALLTKCLWFALLWHRPVPITQVNAAWNCEWPLNNPIKKWLSPVSFFHMFTSNKYRSNLYDCPVKVYVYYSLTWPILFSPICRLIAVTKLITNQESSLISCVFPQVYLFSGDFEFIFQICQTDKTSSVEIFLVLGFTVEQNTPSASKKHDIHFH